MMPTLFPASATSFTTNGLGGLSDTISCKVTEERNGEYTLEMVYPLSGAHFDELVNGNIICAKLDDTRGTQAFRICQITRPINGQVTVYAQHISYQLSMIPCAPFTASSANAALAGLKANAAESCPFTFVTDKTTVATYKQTAPASIRSRLGGVQGSILDCYGGEYEFDNYTVHLWAARGRNRGVVLRYGKNITDLSQEASIADTVTGVYPYYQDENSYVELPEKVISAQSAENFPYHRTIALDLTDQFEEVPTVAQLRTAAQNYIAQEGIGVPRVNVKVSFIPLADTLEYEDLAALETVSLCDTITVKYEKLGVDATAKVIKTVWDVLAERYESIEVGDARNSLATTIAETKQEAAEAVDGSALTQAIARATDLITGVTGGYIRFNRNADGQPYEMLIMDHETVETSTNIWRYNSAGWGFSHDGGATYTTAATIDGGIIADSIVAGTLTGLEIDNGSGTFHVDSAGNMTASSATITNGVLNNGRGTFKVDANGNLTANSLSSNNATITGGSVNISANSAVTDKIKLTYTSGGVTTSSAISPQYITHQSGTTKITTSFVGLDMESAGSLMAELYNYYLAFWASGDATTASRNFGKALIFIGGGSDTTIRIGKSTGQNITIKPSGITLYDTNAVRRASLTYTAGLTFYNASGSVTKQYSAT